MKQVLIIVLTGFLAFPAIAQGVEAPVSAPPQTTAPGAGDAENATEADPAQTAAAEPGAEATTGQPDAPALRVLDAATVTLDEFQWIARPLVVFADTPADPRFREQMELLLARPEELIARDVVVLTDTDPEARSAVRLKLRPRGFMLTLIAKDGTVNLRKPFPWDVREISRAIDKMPMRQEEIRDAKRSGG